jgi:ribosomal protein L17
MTERLQKKIRPPKKTLTELLNDKSIVTGREVVQRIKDKEILRKQFDEAVEFEVRNGRGKR